MVEACPAWKIHSMALSNEKGYINSIHYYHDNFYYLPFEEVEFRILYNNILREAYICSGLKKQNVVYNASFS